MPDAQLNVPHVKLYGNDSVTVAKLGARTKILTNLAPVLHSH